LFKKKYSAVLKDYKKLDINLIPKEYLESKKRLYRAIISSFIAVMIITSISLYFYNLKLKTDNLLLESQNLAIKIEELNKNKYTQEILESIEEKILIKENHIKIIEEDNHLISIILVKLEEKIPKDIYFQSLNANSNGNVTINGIAYDITSIAEFIHSLKEDDFFSNVFVGNISKITNNSRESYSFNLACEIKGD